MSLKQTVLIVSLATPLMLIGPWASAEDGHHHDHAAEHRQHGAHVHGIAALNLALEGKAVQIELDSPAANIVGFEHAPSSADDHAALDNAVDTLNDGNRLFKFNDEAGCRMGTATVTSELLDDEHDHAGETHSDIGAAYHFACDTPDKLTQLSVELFEAFSGMQEIKVQYIIESQQGAAELSAKDHVVKF